MTEQKAKYITNIYNADSTKIDIGDRIAEKDPGEERLNHP